MSKSAAISKIKLQQLAAAGGKSSVSSSPAAASTSSSSNPHHLTVRTGRSRFQVDLLASRPSRSQLVASSRDSAHGLGGGVTQAELEPYGFLAAGVGETSQARGLDAYYSNLNDTSKQADLLYKSAMALATAPGKQLMMTAFMLWMSGNSLQIFSIMMLGMALWTPISELFNIQAKFARYADSGIDLILPKLTFIAMNLAGLGVGLYKCNTMGLLPTSSADWIDMGVRTAVQVSGGGIS